MPRTSPLLPSSPQPRAGGTEELRGRAGGEEPNRHGGRGLGLALVCTIPNIIFSGLKKPGSQTWGRNGAEKKQSPSNLFFFHTIFPPCLVFFRPLIMISSLLFVPDIFQHQGYGNSFRGAKGSLYWSCPILIPSKCWGWSKLLGTLIVTL